MDNGPDQETVTDVDEEAAASIEGRALRVERMLAAFEAADRRRLRLREAATHALVIAGVTLATGGLLVLLYRAIERPRGLRALTSAMRTNWKRAQRRWS